MQTRTEDQIQQVVDVVNAAASLTEAAERLSALTGRTVTRQALGRDCRRLRADGRDIRRFEGARFTPRPRPNHAHE